MAHLCGRPTVGEYCTLGRETALQRCCWDDEGWLRLSGGGRYPSDRVEAPPLPAHPFEAVPEKDDFDGPELQSQWNTLRIPPDPSWLSLTERKGYLRLNGMESLSSWHRQSLVARRVQAFQIEAETKVEFDPEHFQQMAGLILYYDTDDFIYLRITHLEGAGRVLGIIRTVQGQYDEPLESELPLPVAGPIRLKAQVDRERLKFFYAAEGSEWGQAGPDFDIRHLSDDIANPLRFTGTFVGMCVQDLSGTRKNADFDYFIYREV